MICSWHKILRLIPCVQSFLCHFHAQEELKVPSPVTRKISLISSGWAKRKQLLAISSSSSSWRLQCRSYLLWRMMMLLLLLSSPRSDIFQRTILLPFFAQCTLRKQFVSCLSLFWVSFSTAHQGRVLIRCKKKHKKVSHT